MRQLSFHWLGEMSYGDALARQFTMRDEILAGQHLGGLILLSHPPTITVGRHGNEEHVLLAHEGRATDGVSVHRVDRGGDVTYHGPGQLVGYPIVDLTALGMGGVRRYVQRLSLVLQRVLNTWGIEASWDEKAPGLWVGPNKIAAFGVHVHRRITTHGFSLNVCPDMSHFDWIVPCGLHDRGVTSIRCLIGEKSPSLEQVVERVRAEFAWVFGIRWAGGNDRLSHPPFFDSVDNCAGQKRIYEGLLRPTGDSSKLDDPNEKRSYP